MSERRDAERAAERVRKFLLLRSTQVGGDPETIYMLGGPDGELVELKVSDLESLVRAQLGSDVELRVEMPKRRAGVLSGLTSDQVMERVRESYRNSPDTSEEG